MFEMERHCFVAGRKIARTNLLIANKETTVYITKFSFTTNLFPSQAFLFVLEIMNFTV